MGFAPEILLTVAIEFTAMLRSEAVGIGTDSVHYAGPFGSLAGAIQVQQELIVPWKAYR